VLPAPTLKDFGTTGAPQQRPHFRHRHLTAAEVTSATLMKT